MLQIYCPVCNGLLKLNENQKEAVCQNCGRVVPVPWGYTEAESGFLFAAEAMERRDYEGAYAAYSDIITAHPDLAEAYFKRAIASYEIEHQKLSDGSYRLVCHQAEKTDFLENEDVKKALTLSGGAQKADYERQAAEIHALQQQVAAYAKAHPPVDVWLEVSGDSLLSLDKAVQIRQLLNVSGFSVFCPALDLLEDQGGEWESALYRAASTAKLMILAAAEPSAFTEEVNFDAQRFLYRKEKAIRAAKGQIPSLFVVFSGIDEYEDIPDSYFDGIDRRIDMSQPSFASELKEAAIEAMSDYQGALREQAGTHESFSYANVLLKARQTLESGRFADAAAQYEEILLKSPTESQAYWGQLLCQYSCRTEQELIQAGKDITLENNYRNALAFASERERQTYQDVAAKGKEMAAVYAEQERERLRKLEEQEEERRRKSVEVGRAEKKKQKDEQKAGLKRKARIRIFAAAVVILAVGGFMGYKAWTKSPAGIRAATYKKASSAFNRNEYEEAYELFHELGDYKDSEANAEVCRLRVLQNEYYKGLDMLDDWQTRPQGIQKILNARGYINEADQRAEEFKEEIRQYYEEGNLYEAWRIAQVFEQESDLYVKIWREVFGRGILVGSQMGTVLALDEYGNVLQGGSGPFFGLEEEKAISVAISDSGLSAGIVRRDGTAHLVGEASGWLDVSGWSNLVSLKLSDDLAAGLGADGSLYVTGQGKVASHVIQVDVDGSYLIAVREDGSLYCTNPNVQIPGEWSDIAYAILVRDGIVAVQTDGTLLQSGCSYPIADTGVAVVYHGSGRVGALTIEGDMSCSEGDSKEDAGHFAAFSKVPNQGVNLYTDSYGDVNAMIYGVDDEDVAMRNSIRDMEGVNMPSPYAEESEE